MVESKEVVASIHEANRAISSDVRSGRRLPSCSLRLRRQCPKYRFSETFGRLDSLARSHGSKALLFQSIYVYVEYVHILFQQA